MSISSGIDNVAPLITLPTASLTSTTSKDGETEISNNTWSASVVKASELVASVKSLTGLRANANSFPPLDCANDANCSSITSYSSVFNDFSSNIIIHES